MKLATLIAALLALSVAAAGTAAVKPPGSTTGSVAVALLHTPLQGTDTVAGAGCIGVGSGYGTSLTKGGNRFRVWHTFRCNVTSRAVSAEGKNVLHRYWLTVVVTATGKLLKPTIKVTSITYAGCVIDVVNDPCP